MAYNGWTNHNTWAVNLHLYNDPVTSEDTNRIVGEIAELEDNEVFPDKESALAERLKEYVESHLYDTLDSLPDTWGGQFVRDLVTLEHVNWYELAEHYLEDYQE